jgi:hypothetical protein
LNWAGLSIFLSLFGILFRGSYELPKFFH